jgi:hypothetical protein
MNRIIMDELVYGVFKPEGIAYFQQVIRRLKDAGCDAVILGCTEIPLIIDDANSPLPTLYVSQGILALCKQRNFQFIGAVKSNRKVKIGSHNQQVSQWRDVLPKSRLERMAVVVSASSRPKLTLNTASVQNT